MKKILVMCFALVAMGAASYAAESNMMDKKEAKTECKAGAKKACKKGSKCCKKGDKKAADKSCCAKKAK